MARCARGGRAQRGTRSRRVPAETARGAGAAPGHRRAHPAVLRLPEHDPDRPPGRLSRRPRDRGADHGDHALERARDGRAREQGARRARRPHRELRVRRGNLRDRLQPFLPRRRRAATSCSSSRIRRRASTRARFSKGGLPEEQLAHYRQEVGWRGIVVVSASVADARRSGSSRPARWGSARSAPSTRRASCAISRNRGIVDTGDRHVWGVFGDGEMDEPESIGALTLAARERLDNLTFVINCNLQRLDGPVRGNGQIIQELESLFTGAGWNVIKVLWGSDWDPLFARDRHHVLLRIFAGDRRRRVPDARCERRRLQPASISSTSIRNCRRWSSHMSVAEIDALQARRPRPAQALRRVRATHSRTRASRRSSSRRPRRATAWAARASRA